MELVVDGDEDDVFSAEVDETDWGVSMALVLVLVLLLEGVVDGVTNEVSDEM